MQRSIVFPQRVEIILRVLEMKDLSEKLQMSMVSRMKQYEALFLLLKRRAQARHNKRDRCTAFV